MSNNNNRMIVFASILGAILATSILALNPSTITNAGAQMYSDDYSYDNSYQKKSPHVDFQKIKCVNSNINVNGIDITQIPQDDTATAAANEGADATGTQNGNSWGDRINFDRNLVNICVNVNDNEQLKVTAPLTCEDCYTQFLSQSVIDILEEQFLGNIEMWCDSLLEGTTFLSESGYRLLLAELDVSPNDIDAHIQCLKDAGAIFAND